MRGDVMRFSRLLPRFGTVLLFVALGAACARDPKKPGWQIDLLSDMVSAVPSEAFSKSRVFADGKTLQSPPEGTVPRGFEPFPYAKTDADAERAGIELKNPFPPTQANLERGKFVYENFCAMCHGPSGDGDGQLIPRYPNPPAYLDKRLMAMPDGRMFHSIAVGKRDMPQHATQLSAADRWKVILHIRELQKEAGGK